MTWLTLVLSMVLGSSVVFNSGFGNPFFEFRSVCVDWVVTDDRLFLDCVKLSEWMLAFSSKTTPE